MKIQLELDRKEAGFRPGEPIGGYVAMEPPATNGRIRITLGYAISGRVREATVFDAIELNLAQSYGTGRHRFSFVAPHEPNSYEGEDLHITWLLEAEVNSKHRSAAVPLVISPTRHALRPPFVER